MVMSRRKQAKPRALKPDDEDPTERTSKQKHQHPIPFEADTADVPTDNHHPHTSIAPSAESAVPRLLEDDEDDFYSESADDDCVDGEFAELSCDSFYSDFYSSHTSSSFSPSPSEGGGPATDLHKHQTDYQRLTDDCSSPPVRRDDHRHPHHPQLHQRRHPKAAAPDADADFGHDGHGLDRDLVGESVKKTSAGAVGTSGEGTYHCQFCDKTFPRLGYLKKHEQSHAEHMPFKCDYCARLFKHKRSRDRHTKLHTGDRRYRCPHCEAAFSRSDHLKIHMKTHDNQKPFQCTVCNRGYNTAAALTSHMQNHKKQQAALLSGTPVSNYSPRSSGSTGSSTGSLQPPRGHNKRKYSPSLIHPHRVPAMVRSPSALAKRAALGNGVLYCIYCTKNDFQSMDQLHSHIQTKHSAAMINTSPTAQMLNQLSCEFCTMKFPSIPLMFHHMKTAHIDRVNSPNAYMDHLTRLQVYGHFQANLQAHATSPAQEKLSPTLPLDTVIKLERSLSAAGASADDADDEPDKRSRSSAPPIKVELEQDIPTDLSKKTVTVNDDDEDDDNDDRSRNTPVSAGARTPQANSGNFLCSQCNAALPDFEAFRNHLKGHLSQATEATSSLSCPQCGTALQNPSEFERHVLTHYLINTSEFYCNFNCNKTFGKSDELQKHLMDAHMQSLFKCGICSDLFETKVAMQVHFAVAHANEVKLFRCSACVETFKAEPDFRHHVKTRHMTAPSAPGALQCVFCRTTCANEVEMHFHLAAHARQYRCPSCPEAFHVEFLLDRHMQTHHAQAPHKEPSFLFKPNGVQLNNNNNMMDYHYSPAPSVLNKGVYNGNKFYNPAESNTSPNHQQLYGFYDALNKSRFDSDSAKNLLGMYRNELAAKLYANGSDPKNAPNGASFFGSPRSTGLAPDQVFRPIAHAADDTQSMFTCGICDKRDFASECEVHTHRKVAHNVKTGVSLKCAYCNGNFRSRHELETHMKMSHNTSGKHKCLICDEIFPSPAVLAEHKLTHSKVGQSGQCSRCAQPLPDVAAFKAHMADHGAFDIPAQCICCRQTLNSEFEIALHAKFHTKSTSSPEPTCALCLESLPPNSESRKICDKCFKKHNFSSRFAHFTKPTKPSSSTAVDQANPSIGQQEADMSATEHRCNLCKSFIAASGALLQEHLVEHSFNGCEGRGYSCYICSAVFTAASGLLLHMDELHGHGAKPYDCNMCASKFFFRAELEHHLSDHDQGRAGNVPTPKFDTRPSPISRRNDLSEEERMSGDELEEDGSMVHNESSQLSETMELKSEQGQSADEEDEEYIEVETLADAANAVQHESEATDNLAHESDAAPVDEIEATTPN